MSSLMVFLIGAVFGIIIQLAYDVFHMFKNPERCIEVAQQIIDLKEYRDRGY